ncbi:hypothetical protein TRFO_19313 [Tritrichomonas foetus]|uniref:Tubby C-terminal domain-containing protein n=1 Tax=Tritrichomonas foetus TaxID=1144522 RepID=A0A1J4KPH9_9EUKA|nr:hypothetical protein TRFO_19313 [Tritrichomonas foetus]|eukprot:OHT11325.1 hypothetical protein TRFO_19313 [Tritrichomonas foetus]
MMKINNQKTSEQHRFVRSSSFALYGINTSESTGSLLLSQNRTNSTRNFINESSSSLILGHNNTQNIYHLKPRPPTSPRLNRRPYPKTQSSDDESRDCNSQSENDFSNIDDDIISPNLNDSFLVQSLVNSIPNNNALRNKKISYRINRDVKKTFFGKRTHFQLLKGSTPLYHTKLKKTKNVNQIFIGRGKQIHYKDQDFAGVLLACRDNTNFSLRDSRSAYGEEILTIKYSFKLEKQVWCSVCFMNSYTDFGRFLCTRSNAQLDFGGRLVKPSWKNMILEDSNHNEIIATMQVSRDSFYIDAESSVNDIMVFVLGISLFLMKKLRPPIKI